MASEYNEATWAEYDAKQAAIVNKALGAACYTAICTAKRIEVNAFAMGIATPSKLTADAVHTLAIKYGIAPVQMAELLDEIVALGGFNRD